jgi:hypothetical protein
MAAEWQAEDPLHRGSRKIDPLRYLAETKTLGLALERAQNVNRSGDNLNALLRGIVRT